MTIYRKTTWSFFFFYLINGYTIVNHEDIKMNSLETVKSILTKRGVDTSKLKESDSLQDLGLDSLDLVEVMLEIEDTLKVEFSSNEIASLATLKDVADLINSKKA